MTDESNATTGAADADLDARLQALDEAEIAIERAMHSGKADRAQITQVARDSALAAADLVGEAIDADERSDEMGRLAIISEATHDRAKIREARQRARAARKKAKEAHRKATASAKRAYDAIKFSTPGKLGFMRFVQVIFAINIAVTLFSLIMTSRDVIVYDSYTIIDWITIILQGVAFWFFINYYKVARPFVIFTEVFSIVAPAVTNLALGQFSLVETIFGSFWQVFLILYFVFSKRVKAVLVNDFSSYRPATDNANFVINRRGWPFVRNLIIYFIVFSVLGHWMEAGMCQFIRLGLVQGEYDPTNTMLWRDWLYPYPMEGAAVVIIALVLYPLWQWLLRKFADRPIIAYVASFVANALTCGLIEFSMGLVVNADLQLWDYSENFGNIMGQVCLQNVAAFGVAASLIAWVVYPMMERWIARVPNDTMNVVFVVIAVIGGILWSLYIVDPPANHADADGAEAHEEVESSSDLELGALGMSFNVFSLQEDLNADTSIDDARRTQIQERIDDIQKSTDEIISLLSPAS